VHQDAELLILHFALLETSTSDIPPSAENITSDDETESSGITKVSVFFFLQNAKKRILIKNPKNLYPVLVIILFVFVFKKNLQGNSAESLQVSRYG
jgi:hypothetical protein